jgi:hypothetical protein
MLPRVLVQPGKGGYLDTSQGEIVDPGASWAVGFGPISAVDLLSTFQLVGDGSQLLRQLTGARSAIGLLLLVQPGGQGGGDDAGGGQRVGAGGETVGGVQAQALGEISRNTNAQLRLLLDSCTATACGCCCDESPLTGGEGVGDASAFCCHGS